MRQIDILTPPSSQVTVAEAADLQNLQSEITALTARVTALEAHTGVPAPVPAPAPVPPPTPAPSFKIALSSPAANSIVTPPFAVAGMAPGMLNVEVGQGVGLGSAIPDATGAFSIGIADSPSLVGGSTALTVQAWDSPAGTPFTHHDSTTVALTINKPVVAPPPVTGVSDFTDLTKWTLAFNDEFAAANATTASGLAPHWKTWFYFGDRTLSSNGEQEYYMDPAYTGNGTYQNPAGGNALGVNPFDFSEPGYLKIIADHMPAAVIPHVWGYSYSSGLITTETSFAQTYGRFCARLKLPVGRGFWPAFWLLPVDKTWPPEIDSLEAFLTPNANGEGGLTQMHYGCQGQGAFGGWVNTGVDLSADYHVYAVEWTASTLTYFFDDKQVGQGNTPPGYNKPMYMLVNLAVGGNWPGKVDATTPFPSSLCVDFVRAYQAK